MLKFETYDDAVYAHTDYVKYLRRDDFLDLANAWLNDRNNKYGEAASTPSWYAFHYSLTDALGTDILWMTTEMMDLVQSAMQSFDPSEPVRLDDIFLKDGFLVLPHSFLSADISGKQVGWRVMCWKTVDPMVKWVNDIGDGPTAYTYDISMEGEPEPGVRFMQISWTWDDDTFTEEYPEMTKELRDSGENWGVAHATAIPLRYMNDEREMSGEGDRNASWLLFWRVMQKLMAETIVKSDPQHPGRPARREAQRFQMPPSILRVVELRRARSHKEGEGRENGSREYTHRWIVRGHWRNQWYPSEGRHKQKYIGEYIKGPDDLDLIVKQRVFNWDR
jgi:hypothetical protein